MKGRDLMALYRNIQLSFWTDNKVEDDFTPEDKYFYLYLLTNPQTNICGCYEASWSQMTRQTGYTKDTLLRLLDRFENVHKILKFNKETKEILILHWHKYNWSKSEKVLVGVESVAKHIKCLEFKDYIFSLTNSIRNDSEIQYVCPNVTSVSVPVSNINIIKEIIDYLNNKLGTKYNYNTKSTQRHINARLAEGRTLEEFKAVIDKKYDEWGCNDKMKNYLRPETLFGTKFESYLNQGAIKVSGGYNWNGFLRGEG